MDKMNEVTGANMKTLELMKEGIRYYGYEPEDEQTLLSWLGIRFICDLSLLTRTAKNNGFTVIVHH